MGRIPETEYFAAVRQLGREARDDIYLNLGFETDERSEFCGIMKFLSDYEKRDRELFKLLFPLIVKDIKDSSFGIKINLEEFGKFVDRVNGCESTDSIDAIDKFSIHLKVLESTGDLADRLLITRVYNGKYVVAPDPVKGKGWVTLVPRGCCVPGNTQKQAPAADTVGEKKTRIPGMVPMVVLIVILAFILCCLIVRFNGFAPLAVDLLLCFRV